MTSTIDKKLHSALPSTEDCDPKSQRGGRWTRRINRLRSTLRGMYLVPDLDDDDDPDFDETFDPDAQTLTPRQCVVVARVATELADAVFADAHLLGNRPVQPGSGCAVLADLPECTWTQDATWRRTMARSFDDLSADAAAGLDPEPRCTGEEMALRLIIGRARTAMISDRFVEELTHLPAHKNDDDWDGPLDYLFQDHDVLTLFWAEPISDGVNLDPEDWFTPFEPELARDEDRGFRT